MRTRMLIRYSVGALFSALVLLVPAACGSPEPEPGERVGARGEEPTGEVTGEMAGPVAGEVTGAVTGEMPGEVAGGMADAGLHETDVDWVIARGKVEWARSQSLHLLPVGEIAAILGTTFVGAPYEPGSLELPGPEALVVNLRTFDCVTFVESVLVLARLTLTGPDPSDGDAFRRAYRDELTRLRYRGGVLSGYPSRLHYFSEWIRNGEEKGLVEDVSPALGGVVDLRPITFMGRHPDAYRQLAQEPALLDDIREMETRISAVPRHFIPKDRIDEVANGIRNGDVIAAVSTVEGLDIAHTGLAVWHDGQLYLLHAPLVGDSVEISPRPLAERIMEISSQQGIMVARPLEPASAGGAAARPADPSRTPTQPLP